MPDHIPESRSIPVPHGIAVPLKQDNRWKYGLAAALALLLLLLLLLLAFGAKSTGIGDSRQQTADGSEDGGQQTAAETEDGGQQTVAETADGGKQQTPDSAEYGTDEETALPDVTESEPARTTAIVDLLRRLDAEQDESADSNTDDHRERNQSGGDALVKGDASVNFFGATGKGSKFVFVFDRSTSMTGGPLESVKRELIQALEPLKSNHTFNIIAYNHMSVSWKDRLMAATTANKSDAIKFIERINAGGLTEPREPLLIAIRQKPEIIFFMTDGEFHLNVDEICRAGRGITISVVQFSDSFPLAVLQELARRTGGDFMLIKISGLSDSL